MPSLSVFLILLLSSPQELSVHQQCRNSINDFGRPLSMSPREDTSLLSKKDELSHLEYKSHTSDFEDIGDITLLSPTNRSVSRIHPLLQNIAIVVTSAILAVSLQSIYKSAQIKSGHLIPTGPYRLVEAQYGSNFFDFYDFYDGPDSLGSAGYNVYVSKESAMQSQLAGVKVEDGEEFVYMSSAPTEDGPRDSVRLEGKRRFERGLFVLDVVHMPNGPGVWPAFWLTDEAAWPRNGEVDILEGTAVLSCIFPSSSYLRFLIQCVIYSQA
jgi:hypothetical protein